jgi:hypothetical protein
VVNPAVGPDVVGDRSEEEAIFFFTPGSADPGERVDHEWPRDQTLSREGEKAQERSRWITTWVRYPARRETRASELSEAVGPSLLSPVLIGKINDQGRVPKVHGDLPRKAAEHDVGAGLQRVTDGGEDEL